MIAQKDRMALHRFQVKHGLNHKDTLSLVYLAQEGELHTLGWVTYTGNQRSPTEEMGQGSSAFGHTLNRLEERGLIDRHGHNRNAKIEIPARIVAELKSFVVY